ncbi:MAG: hypothetical protein IJR91_03145 [Ruminococcus sp.]|nr:hypothetical protein [Ruminococcus sp.]
MASAVAMTAAAGIVAAAGSEKIGTAPVSGMSAAVAAAETKAAPKAVVKTEETNEMGKHPGESGYQYNSIQPNENGKFPGEAGYCCQG